MPYVDSHCHLDFPDFADDLDGIVAGAQSAGVQHILTICTRVRRFEQVRSVTRRFDQVYASVGTHPHNAHEELDVSVEDLVSLAEDPKVIAIGEAGLDYFYHHFPPEAQAAGFGTHIAAARLTGLPLVIHARDADADMIAILKEEGERGAFPAVLHCFSSGRELAEVGIALGHYVSFSGILTFKNAHVLRDIARDLPADRLLVETDAPYLAPTPYRGARNEPAYVVHTAACLAEARGVAGEVIAETTSGNFFRLFSKAPQP